MRFDLRFSGGDPKIIRAYAEELVSLAPDVIVAYTVLSIRALQQQTRSIPIVFAAAGDVLALGIVASLSHPEGNTTGFANNFASFGGKWLELLKEAVPRLERVGVLYYSENLGGLFSSIEAASASLAVTTYRIPYHDAQEIERAIEGFAAEPNGGLIIHPPTPVGENRNAINLFTTRYRLPTIYGSSSFLVDGGLMSYGPNFVDQFRQAASYVDRILRGAKLGDLPVQYPTKVELAINLKTARAIGLEIPSTMLLRTDEVIE
jgi:putative ABC transport system substrate-binding protein